MAGIGIAQDFFTLKGHVGPIKRIAAGTDGTIVTANFDNSVGLWRQGLPHWLERREAAVNAVAYHAGAARIAVGDAHGYIMMLDTETRRIASGFRATVSGPIRALAFAADGQSIPAGGLDNAMCSWPITDLADAAQMVDGGPEYLNPPAEKSNGESQFQRKWAICHTLGPVGKRRAHTSLPFRMPGRQRCGLQLLPHIAPHRHYLGEVTIDRLFELGQATLSPDRKSRYSTLNGATDRADLIGFCATPPGRTGARIGVT